MAAGDKKKKASAEDKKEPAKTKEAVDTTAAKPDMKADTKADAKTETKADAKTDTKPEAEAPASYSRGEGQKPVTQAYKDNWNAIYGKKKRK